MSEPGKPPGPDLAAGVPAARLERGVPLLGHVGEEPVVLVKSTGATFAVGATCSHYNGPLAEGIVVGDTIRCPWHHACFDLRTGEATGAPALDDVPCFQVLEEAGRVRVGERRPAPRRRLDGTGPASIAVLGAGAAGSAAVETLRREGYEGPVTLVGAEAPVDRPDLSKDYLAGSGRAAAALRPAAFYRAIDVTLRVGPPATALDVERRRITFADGAALEYGALLLALGAEPVRLSIPGATLPHVHVLRTLDDANAIAARTMGARRAAILGASFIGLEAAASLRRRGLEVDVIGPEPLPLARILGEELGRFVKSVHEAHGVRFRLSTRPRAIRPRHVELESGGTVDADLVVMGIGVRPRTALAQSAGLAVQDGGVVLDRFLATSAPGVFAAGDIARYPEPRLGQPVRIEHWVMAGRQGQAAARAMLGRGQPFQDVPFFWSLHHGVNIDYVGHAPTWDTIEVRGDIAARNALVVYRKGERPLAVVTIDRDRDSLLAEAALERGGSAALEAFLAGGRSAGHA